MHRRDAQDRSHPASHRPHRAENLGELLALVRIRDSDLDWTIMRPPGLIDRRLRGSYRVAIGRNVRGGVFISRSDVAHGMLDAVDRAETIGQTIGIAYRDRLSPAHVERYIRGRRNCMMTSSSEA